MSEKICDTCQCVKLVVVWSRANTARRVTNLTNPIEFSLNGDAFCRFYKITRKQKKNPATKCYPYRELTPGPLTLLSCMLLSELIRYLPEVTRPLDPYNRALLIY